MAKTVGKLTFADDITAILKDADLLECVEDWAQARQALAANLLMLIQTNMNADRIYEHFLAIGAAHTLDIRLNDALVERMHHLAAAQAWDDPLWKPLVKKLKEDAIKTVDSKYLPKFWDSNEFEDYCKEKAEKSIGKTADAAKELGVADNEALRKLMVAARMGSAKDMKKYADDIAKKHKTVGDADKLLTRLKKKMGL